jgi:hypothetical protein
MLVATVPLAAQSRSSHGGGGGGGRTAHSTGSSHSGGSGSPHSSGGGGRSAHEVPGGSSGGGHRGPGGDHGGHGGGGWHGGYGGRGGFYYPWGWGGGFWPSFSFWYGDPYYYYPPYGGYGYYGNYGYGGYEGGGYGRYDRNDMGALDLDVSPGRTHVFVNGEDLGIVDKYDGWPGYLWLPRGTYDVAFYLDGYKTIARQITIYPGSVIDIDDHMEQGQSVRPEDLASKTHERRDDRLRYERERRQQLEQQGYNNDDDWRDRAHRDRSADRDDDRNMDRNDMDRNDTDRDNTDRNQGRTGGRRYDRDRNQGDNGSQHGSLRLMVDPEDASIYLDGRFIGTGGDVSTMRGGLRVTPGHHQISVVRPGRRAEERNFDVKAGEDVKVDVRLEGGAG